MVLEEKDQWGIVKGDEVEPTDEGTTDAQRRQFQRWERKALATICLSLGDEQLPLVRSAATARGAYGRNWKVSMKLSPWRINCFYVKSILLCLWELMSR